MGDLCRGEILLHGKEQLRDHVPVDAAESLKTEHAAAATGEGTVVEHLLVNGADLFGIGGNGVRPGGVLGELGQRDLERFAIDQVGMEAGQPGGVAVDEAVIALSGLAAATVV